MEISYKPSSILSSELSFKSHCVETRLYGNPVCSSNLPYCREEQQPAETGYSTSLTNCGSKLCPPDQELNPKSCDCAYAYKGTLYFRAPSFRELSNSTNFHALESNLWTKLGLPPGSVSLRNPFLNSDDYLQVQLELFPPSGKYFSRAEVLVIGFDLSNQTFKPPKEFGPYYFIASPYTFPGNHTILLVFVHIHVFSIFDLIVTCIACS